MLVMVASRFELRSWLGGKIEKLSKKLEISFKNIEIFDNISYAADSRHLGTMAGGLGRGR
jgi:hypothetical protein